MQPQCESLSSSQNYSDFHSACRCQKSALKRVTVVLTVTVKSVIDLDCQLDISYYSLKYTLTSERIRELLYQTVFEESCGETQSGEVLEYLG